MAKNTFTAFVDVSYTAREDVEVDVDDLDDEALLACVEEAGRRGLTTLSPGMRDGMKDVLSELLRKRHQKAFDLFEKAYFAESAFLDAYRAMQAGDWNAAIAFLDRGLDPGPSAKATAIPKDQKAAQEVLQ